MPGVISRNNSRHFSLLIPLFFISGACGLIYQVLWLRLLGLVFGVTVYAASTVWASFMGGLALGSFLGGRLGDRVARPLFWFGVAEVLVGVSALATPSALNALQQLYLPLQSSYGASTLSITLIRLLVSFAALVIPTMMMGASLPLIVRAVMTRHAALGGKAGALYAANTAGAILGTLVAGLVLIPGLGIRQTFAVAAAANLFVGVIAMVVAALMNKRPVAIQSAADHSQTDGLKTGGSEVQEHAYPTRVRQTVLGLFFLSGLTSLALEVIWFRMIVLIVRPTVYAFSLMLAAVLAGIAFGSAIVTPLMRRQRDWPWILAVVQLLTGTAALLSLMVLNYTNTLQQWLGPTVGRFVPDYLTYTIITAVPAVLPTSILLGIAFPIGLHIWGGTTDARAPVSSRVGVFYSLNVAGAILGSLVAGFIALPALGSRVSLIVVAALMFGGGLLLLSMLETRSVRRWVLTGALAASFAAVTFAVDDPFRAFLRVRYPTDRVVWHDESVQTTVSVHRQNNGGLSMHLEGNHQASDQRGMAFVHQRIGLLPVVVHPNPTSALVIGLGGGATAGAVALDSGIHVTVVELSRAVVEGARYFTHINYGVLSKPNVELRVDDGRNFLLTTDRKFDVVTADIILPIYAGSNNLYSAEYFRLVKRVLKPGGLFVQWVAGTEAEYQVITRTFLSVFPEATAWVDGGLLLGGPDRLVLSRDAFEKKLATPARLPSLDALGVKSFEDLLRLYRAGAAELRQFIGHGPSLTDDRPLVEYFLSLPRDRDVNLSGLQGDVHRHVR